MRLAQSAALALLLQACTSLLATASPPQQQQQQQQTIPAISWAGAFYEPSAANLLNLPDVSLQAAGGDDKKRPPGCPECPEPSCFNCQLPAFNCAQFGSCSEYDGICSCPTGFGGQDCLSPLCGSPAEGDKRFPREDEGKGDASCDCSPGWTGLNCNVCKPPRTQTEPNPCANFMLGGERLGENGTCYNGGATVRHGFQECAVTNKRITDMLPGRPPRVSFACKKEDTCNFQFWIGQKESFYCALEDCTETLDRTSSSNNTRHECQKVQCECIPGRMLCGESGSVDIGDFLKEEIKGPGSITCKNGKNGERDCRFDEPGMSQLISDVFGDEAIFLSCDSGECVHYSQVPGYLQPAPPPPRVFWVAFSACAAIFVVIVASASLWFLGRHYKDDDDLGAVRLPEEEAARLMQDHVPAALHFDKLAYRIGEKAVLDGITGSVKPGQTMAIVGASGAGKTTFLDILAGRNKRGTVSGAVLVNGRRIAQDDYQRIVGFVDQEDCLMPTLTVYETVLYSALLRLPRDMSIEAKRFRTLETISELGLLGVKDSRIGDAGHRSISGGEKRRVSIACELVTSPSILFCDEPTSGLDAYNAHNVIESLVTLARNYNRTIVFTIHQPRSDIVALFDHLVLLAAGKMVYSGPLNACGQYFEDIGHGCPPGFNLGDHLVDLSANATHGNSRPLSQVNGSGASPYRDEEAGGTSTALTDDTELHTRSGSMATGSTPSSLRQKTGRLAAGVRNAFSARPVGPATLAPQLAALVDSFAKSSIAADVRGEITAFETPSAANALPDASEGARNLRGYATASLWTQFYLLSGRAFKNLYRNPMLMAAHYVMSVVLALFCGLLYHGITNDIAGFQNRLGLFFFILALFGFSTLTSLGVFANERVLFVRERANGYYSPVTYFTSKLLFDILPLRVIPPFILGGIVYFLVGLVPQVAVFWKFILTLVLFSLAASSAVLFISIAIKDTGVANLVGSLTMLFNLLFAGLLINRERIPYGLRWLQHLSFFHAAYEALLINELRTLTLREVRYGLSIDVPAATILSSFGFAAQAFWWPDIATLGIITASFWTLSLIWLIVFVKEKK